MTGLSTLLQTGDTGPQFCQNWDNIKSQDEKSITEKRMFHPQFLDLPLLLFIFFNKSSRVKILGKFLNWYPVSLIVSV